ncbi:hypothetical protein [Latilactobacillus curvatus]|jgi:hypothetical protein|uniref:hypothetical protein n=1 Tax=Latilactobacillus curvatus TaxID=28038 RepID=UPI000B5EDCFF|nr:hypothetical protein [Latilactobacillus curvatus]ASN62119.1 hypothetical protein CGZ47_06010 [Latilactobacillus curvatus]MCT2879534.1 hypothetical protein [Latilactobacillus curvatus]
MDFKKVQAVLAVKENKKEDVGKLSSVGSSDDDLLLQSMPDVETEVYTKYDFDEPREENFINFIKRIKDPEDSTSDKYGFTWTFLTELED